MESIRQQKVSRLLQREIGDIFTKKEVNLSVNLMISVTQIRVSPDLGVARSYLSLFPSNNREEVIEEIRKHTKEIRYILGKKVGQQLRHIPELYFYLDDSFDYAEKIDKLLK
ncbi:30S ribosome-binding factor RbfA [Vicingaceae bacterium]|nr:30S ribosome-binding factor RbfA [Vicingaceae bacterium]MDC1451473.1 30S ribosome-binding factor RbfA [Vicingaceae bacterium]